MHPQQFDPGAGSGQSAFSKTVASRSMSINCDRTTGDMPLHMRCEATVHTRDRRVHCDIVEAASPKASTKRRAFEADRTNSALSFRRETSSRNRPMVSRRRPARNVRCSPKQTRPVPRGASLPDSMRHVFVISQMRYIQSPSGPRMSLSKAALPRRAADNRPTTRQLDRAEMGEGGSSTRRSTVTERSIQTPRPML